ncbi:MAG: hypothetical protein J5841_05040, partial [Clostridia bacterium]|nr:hypothetical protein [Clostridia bacterium]
RLICNTNFQRLPACNTKRDLRNTKFQVFEKPRNFVLQNGSSEFNSPGNHLTAGSGKWYDAKGSNNFATYRKTSSGTGSSSELTGLVQ